VSIQSEIKDTIDTIALFQPKDAARFRTLFDVQIALIANNEWSDFLSATLSNGNLFDNSLLDIVERARLLPPSDEIGKKLDGQLTEWLHLQISEHDLQQAENYKTIVASKRRIITALAEVSLPDTFANSQTHISQFLSRLDREIKNITWDGFLADKLSPESDMSVALSNIASLTETMAPDPTHVRQLDRKIFDWLRSSLSGGETNTGDAADYQKSATKKRALAKELASTELPEAFIASREFIGHNIQSLNFEANKIEWFGFFDVLLVEGDIFEDTLERLSTKAASLPPNEQYADQLVARTKTWISEEISAYEGLMASGYLSDVAEKQKLVAALKKTRLPAPFDEAQAILETEASRISKESNLRLAELVTVAQSVITDSGESYVDLAEVVEETTSLSAEFQTQGFSREAETLLAFGMKHVDGLIALGLKELKSELTNTAMTREEISRYQSQANQFDALSQQFEAFDAYVIAIEDGIASGRKKECINQYQRATSGKTFQINIGDDAIELKELACQLYVNNHILQTVDHGGWLSSKSLTIDRWQGESEQFELQRLEDSDVYYGAKRLGDNPGDIAVADWQSYIRELVIPPPTGKPNARGVTECDKLAADPQDPNKVGAGIKLADQPAEFDFDRAIDACIAAIDYAPDQSRNYHQLARLLNFLGMVEEAKAYADIAVKAGYPPSYHLSAEMKMMEEGDDAFFDAIDLLKLGAKAGHTASRTLLAELVPPGSNLFRPMPTPDDDTIVAAYGRSECTPSIFGMQTCIKITGVHSKNCFQISADEFSCELKLRFRCETRGERLFRAMVQAACSSSNGVSDVQFRNLKKVGENRWRAYEPR
jgi:tetratricopeptide (TPR) repeat protein